MEFHLLPVDLLTARTHARIGAALAGKGAGIGVHDLWLAAVCISRGFTLATGNARNFARIPGLKLEVWGREG